ncbi:MAG TPA: hypothetical protein VND20_07905 [Candidatus Binataceae bacterium]|nr:hypothetical protein [Candidatus Binataceae bacterium]
MSPTNSSTVFFGGVGLYTSADSGNTWLFFNPSPTDGAYHSDQHALAFDPFDSAAFYAGNDGGLFYYNGSSFAAVNDGLNTAQLYGVALNSGPPFTVLGGFQDNGTELYTGSLGWTETDTGDAAVVQFSPVDQTYAYHTYMGGGSYPTFIFSADGGNSWPSTNNISADWQTVLQSHGDTTIVFPPIAASPTASTPHRVLVAGHKAYSLVLGTTDTWKLQSNTDLTAACPVGNGACAVQDIEFDPYDGAAAWAVSTPSGAVGYKVSCTGSANLNSGAAWTNITHNLTALTSTQFPTGITVSPFKDPATGHAVVYVTMYAPAGSTAPTGTIFKTTGGCLATGTWSALAAPSYNGEPLSVLRLLVDNTDSTGNTLLAGTDIGVYRSTDGGVTWADYDMGIVPHVPVTDIEQNPAGVITIATHGAGSYLLPTQIQFAGYANATESEPPSTCNQFQATTTVKPPSGAQNGDIFAMPIAVGDETGGTSLSVPAGWSILPFANQGNASSIITATGSCSTYVQSWVAVHSYSTGDTTPYSFGASITPIPGTGACSPCISGEIGGFLTSYRGADQRSADYTAYAYPNSGATASTTDPVSVAGPDELVSIFTGLAEKDENNLCETFAAPTGPQTLTVETPLTPVCTEPPFLDADIWTDSPGGSFGGYSVIPGSISHFGTGPLPAYQVVLPPLE